MVNACVISEATLCGLFPREPVDKLVDFIFSHPHAIEPSAKVFTSGVDFLVLTLDLDFGTLLFTCEACHSGGRKFGWCGRRFDA